MCKFVCILSDLTTEHQFNRKKNILLFLLDRSFSLYDNRWCRAPFTQYELCWCPFDTGYICSWNALHSNFATPLVAQICGFINRIAWSLDFRAAPLLSCCVCFIYSDNIIFVLFKFYQCYNTTFKYRKYLEIFIVILDMYLLLCAVYMKLLLTAGQLSIS